MQYHTFFLLALLAAAAADIDDEQPPSPDDIWQRQMPWYQGSPNAIYPGTPSPFDELLAYLSSLMRMNATLGIQRPLPPLPSLPPTTVTLPTTTLRPPFTAGLTLPNEMVTPLHLQLGYAQLPGITAGQSIQARYARQLPNDVKWPSAPDRYYTLMMIREWDAAQTEPAQTRTR